MTRGVGVLFLIVGVGLLVYGYRESSDIATDFSNLFSGKPTNKTVWFIIGGAVATLLGLYGTLRGRKK